MILVVHGGRLDRLVSQYFLRLTIAFRWLTGRNALPLARLFWVVEVAWLGFMVRLVGGPAFLTAFQLVALCTGLLMTGIDRWNIRASMKLHIGMEFGGLDARSVAILTGTSILRNYALVIGSIGLVTGRVSNVFPAWAVYWMLKVLTLNFSRVIIPRGPSAWKRAKGKFKNVRVPRLIPAPSPA